VTCVVRGGQALRLQRTHLLAGVSKVGHVRFAVCSIVLGTISLWCVPCSMSLLVDISGIKSSHLNLKLADPCIKCKYANFQWGMEAR
jgi:hypothetical protein